MREASRYTMNFGLYTGGIFVAVILIFHFAGRLHFPGDQVSWINAAVMIFMMIKSGRKYKEDYFGNNLSISQAIKYNIQLGIYSSVVLACFSYFYYGIIAPAAIPNFIDYMVLALNESPTVTEEQKNMMIDLYRSNLNAGIMTVITLFCQIAAAIVTGLFASAFIKTPAFKNIKNEH